MADKKPVEELKDTLAEIAKRVEDTQGKITENTQVFEDMKKDLTDRMDAMAAANTKRETDVATGPEHKMVVLGKARGLKVEDLWNMPAADEEMKAWQDEGDLIQIAAAAYAFKKSVSQETAFSFISKRKEFSKWSSETSVLKAALEISGSAGTGVEFVPEEFSANLIDRVTLGLRVAALHERMQLPRNPFRLPAMVAALPKGFKVVEQTSENFLADASTLPKLTVQTRKVTWDAFGIGALTVMSAEFDEDSIIPGAEFARNELVTSLQNAQEAAVINGSEEGTHPDFDTTASTAPEKMWDGYRMMAIRPSTDTTLDFLGAAPTSSLIRSLRSKMGKYGSSPQNLAYVMSITVLLKHLIGFPEFLTLDKIGPTATVLTGQLAQFDGSPVVVSDFARDDVSSTGFNTTGGPNTLSTIEIVHRPSMRFGDVRGVNVETIRWPVSDQVIVVGKMRTDFEDIHDSTAETIVAMGINVLP